MPTITTVLPDADQLTLGWASTAANFWSTVDDVSDADFVTANSLKQTLRMQLAASTMPAGGLYRRHAARLKTRGRDGQVVGSVGLPTTTEVRRVTGGTSVNYPAAFAAFTGAWGIVPKEFSGPQTSTSTRFTVAFQAYSSTPDISGVSVEFEWRKQPSFQMELLDQTNTPSTVFSSTHKPRIRLFNIDYDGLPPSTAEVVFSGSLGTFNFVVPLSGSSEERIDFPAVLGNGSWTVKVIINSLSNEGVKFPSAESSISFTVTVPSLAGLSFLQVSIDDASGIASVVAHRSNLDEFDNRQAWLQVLREQATDTGYSDEREELTANVVGQFAQDGSLVWQDWQVARCYDPEGPCEGDPTYSSFPPQVDDLANDRLIFRTGTRYQFRIAGYVGGVLRLSEWEPYGEPIAVTGVGFASTTTANSYPMTIPQAAPGDLMFMVVRAGGVSMETPLGWTLLQLFNAGALTYIFARVAESDEPTQVNLVPTIAAHLSAVMWRFRQGLTPFTLADLWWVASSGTTAPDVAKNTTGLESKLWHGQVLATDRTDNGIATPPSFAIYNLNAGQASTSSTLSKRVMSSVSGATPEYIAGQTDLTDWFENWQTTGTLSTPHTIRFAVAAADFATVNGTCVPGHEGEHLLRSAGPTIQREASTVRTNHVVNPSFETNVLGWTGTLLSRVTTTPKYGTACASILIPSGSEMSMHQNSGSPNTYQVIPVAGGQWLQASAWVRLQTGAARQVQCGIEFSNSGGLISTIPYGAPVTLNTTWQRAVVTAQAPANATHARVKIYAPAQPSDATTLVDGVLFEKIDQYRNWHGEYFDGSFADVPNPNSTTPLVDYATVAQTVVRQNKINNPSYEANTNGWQAVRSTLTRITSPVALSGAGTSCAQIVNDATANTHYITPPSASRQLVTEGTTVIYSFYGRLPAGGTGGTQRTARLFFYDAGGVVIGTSIAGVPVNLTDTAWTRAVVIATVPPGATHCACSPTAAAGTENETWLVDGNLLEQSDTLAPYFDGDTPDVALYDYGWLATAHASNSTQTTTANVHTQTVSDFQEMSGPAGAWFCGSVEWDYTRPNTVSTGIEGTRFQQSAPSSDENVKLNGAVRTQDELEALQEVMAGQVVYVYPDDAEPVYVAPTGGSGEVVKVGRVRTVSYDTVAVEPQPDRRVGETV